MSENSWVLKGVEPEVRERAVEEAARLGMPLADYLTDMVLRSALAEQFAAQSEAEPSAVDGGAFIPPPESPEGFAIRHRLKALERRLSSAVGSLDGTLHGLDTSLFDITARVGEVEALAGDTAAALGQTQESANNTFTGVQIHLAVIEDNLGALAHAQDERATGLGHRISYVEDIARGAQQSAGVLTDAHEALKHAVASDFSDLAQQTTARLSFGLEEVRAAAEDAAAQADAAVAHLVNELRSMRQALDDRMAESAAETRARMHAVFAESSDRLGALTDRVIENERFTARAAEQLRVQVTDVEDGLQIALEETAQSLRETDAALAGELSRTTQDTRAALEDACVELTAEIRAMREDQTTQLARLKLVDVAISNTINDLGTLREAVEDRVGQGEAAARALVEEAHTDWTARFSAVGLRAAAADREAHELRHTLTSEIERVEACTLASLEKLGRDIGAGDSAIEHRVELAAQHFRAEFERMREQAAVEADEARARIAGDVNRVHEEQAGVMARLTLLDGAIARVESSAAPMNQRMSLIESALAAPDPAIDARLVQLERATAGAETEQALDVIRANVAALAQRLESFVGDSELADRVNALFARLHGNEAQAGELNEKLQGVARMLNRVAAQTVESASKTEERAHQVELAVADMRLHQLSTAEANAAAEAVQTLEQRLEAMERRQSEAFDALQSDIARFIDDNTRRLAALESPTPEDGALIAQFDELRRRVEDRIHGVEQRSVRTLEQVADTVAMIEQRFIQAGGDAGLAARSA
jgi:hypothetical protein